MDPDLEALPQSDSNAIAASPSTSEKRFERTEWRWSEREANLLYSAQHQITGYEVQITRRAETDNFADEPFTVRILREGKQVYSFLAHRNTVFVESSGVIYVAEFSPIATGRTLVAYDFRTQKELCRCDLKGNPPPGHSKYAIT
ncbi:MAG TPA: hypothetical protein VKS79_23740 [Gemmataceae bacterium]|nr:hypothetical protein [Gemmataceae bacterium]